MGLKVARTFRVPTGQFPLIFPLLYKNQVPSTKPIHKGKTKHTAAVKPGRNQARRENRSLGVEAQRITEPDQLSDAIKKSFKSDTPKLIEVPVRHP
jgi:thiamine pyrophosphate-dependent acetolactate synthase large subunit-like protein